MTSLCRRNSSALPPCGEPSEHSRPRQDSLPHTPDFDAAKNIDSEAAPASRTVTTKANKAIAAKHHQDHQGHESTDEISGPESKGHRGKENIAPSAKPLCAFISASVCAMLSDPGCDDDIDGYTAVPDMSVPQAVQTLITKTGSCEYKSSLACAIMERVVDRSGQRECSRRNGARLYLVSLLLAWKMVEDAPPLNAEWGTVFGWFSLEEINLMEWDFLKVVGYDLSVEKRAMEIANTFLLAQGEGREREKEKEKEIEDEKE